jgi:hypothetical protein
MLKRPCDGASPSGATGNDAEANRSYTLKPQAQLLPTSSSPSTGGGRTKAQEFRRNLAVVSGRTLAVHHNIQRGAGSDGHIVDEHDCHVEPAAGSKRASSFLMLA